MVSVIVLMRNNIAFTKQLVESMLRNDAGIEHEVIFVDNASDDGTAEYFRNAKNFTGMNGKYIRNNENKGYSIANNQGILAADSKSDLYCFLNNDMLVTRHWLREMVECYKRHNNCVIVGSKLLHPGTRTIQHAGIKENSELHPEHLYYNRPEDYPKANEEVECFAVTGASMLIEKEFFNSVSGFDEKYWCGWEDIDMCQRAKEKGKSIWYAPKSVLYHYEGMTEGRMKEEGKNFNLYMHRWILKH